MSRNNTRLLPEVGEQLMRTMTAPNFDITDSKPEPCTVVYVNEPHHYYTVRFKETGIQESYGVLLNEKIKERVT